MMVMLRIIEAFYPSFRMFSLGATKIDVGLTTADTKNFQGETDNPTCSFFCNDFGYLN